MVCSSRINKPYLTRLSLRSIRSRCHCCKLCRWMPPLVCKIHPVIVVQDLMSNLATYLTHRSGTLRFALKILRKLSIALSECIGLRILIVGKLSIALSECIGLRILIVGKLSIALSECIGLRILIVGIESTTSSSLVIISASTSILIAVDIERGLRAGVSGVRCSRGKHSHRVEILSRIKTFCQ